MARPPSDAPLSGAERVARSRGRGRPLSTVLRHEGAIAVLDRLTRKGATQREVVERALLLLGKLGPAASSRKAAK